MPAKRKKNDAQPPDDASSGEADLDLPLGEEPEVQGEELEEAGETEASDGEGGSGADEPAEPGDPVALRSRVNTNFLEYASYVIRDRAIPHIDDGLKPVQRRILWSLHRNDDGKFIKVANISGYCMQFHPHGNASIDDALVVLTNKRYLIEGQGNYGNIFTGDPAAASRYIECRLTRLAREYVFNDELTETIPSYDGRNKEPVNLPSKLPLLLMLGTEGIAVGLSARILPHNFIELLEAQICILRKKPFQVLPDFYKGGLMDASQYADGKGSVKMRARIEVRDSSTLAITELTPYATSESLIASIEDAARKGKIKIRSINDFTSEKVEIEIKLSPGVDAEQMVAALYAFTECETSISSRIIVIKDNRPVELTVTEVLQHNTAKLVEDLRRELQLEEHKLLEELHFRTLVRIFIENRIYKRIEECKTNEAVFEAVFTGFEPFKKELIRELTDKDVEMLLGVRIRRISLFDINKHKEETEKVLRDLDACRKNLANLTKYTIGLLKGLIKDYTPEYPRLTEISTFEAVAAREVALKSFKVTYDREKGILGHKSGGEEYEMACSKYDKLLYVGKDGRYMVVNTPDKLYVGTDLVWCGIPDREQVFVVAYKQKDYTYMKRFTFGGTIANKEYNCLPPGSKVLYFAEDGPEELFIKYKPAAYQKVNQQTVNPGDLAVKSAKARGNQVSIKQVASISSKKPRNWDSETSTSRVRFI